MIADRYALRTNDKASIRPGADRPYAAATKYAVIQTLSADQGLCGLENHDIYQRSKRLTYSNGASTSPRQTIGMAYCRKVKERSARLQSPRNAYIIAIDVDRDGDD